MTSHRTGPPALDAGVWWIDEKGTFQSAMGLDKSFDRIFLGHYGQVKFTSDRQGIRIGWDVRKVEDGAIDAAAGRLLECGSNSTVHLSFFYYGWVNEMLADPPTAASRILQVQRHREIELVRSTYMEEHDVSEADSAAPLIRDGFKFWESTGGRFNKAGNEWFAGYLPNCLIFRWNKREDELVFSHVGNKSMCARAYGDEWVADTIGQSLDLGVGPERQSYTDRVNLGIASAMETGEPNYQHFRTILYRDNCEPQWFSYQRLVSRHTLHDGRPGVVVLSCQAEDISIPFARSP